MSLLAPIGGHMYINLSNSLTNADPIFKLLVYNNYTLRYILKWKKKLVELSKILFWNFYFVLYRKVFLIDFFFKNNKKFSIQVAKFYCILWYSKKILLKNPNFILDYSLETRNLTNFRTLFFQSVWREMPHMSNIM